MLREEDNLARNSKASKRESKLILYLKETYKYGVRPCDSVKQHQQSYSQILSAVDTSKKLLCFYFHK